MINRLYVHNFRCLENFELRFDNQPSSLLIGKNGTGKSTVGIALKIFQNIGRGTGRVRELIKIKDFCQNRTDVPIRFELEVVLNEQTFKYSIAFELPENFRELRILDEQLSVDGETIYSRDKALVSLHQSPHRQEATFKVDWHLVALPIIQMESEGDALHIFKSWLAKMVLLSPIPRQMKGESQRDVQKIDLDGKNIGDWFSALLNRYPAAYMIIDKYLREIIPDILDIQNEETGSESKEICVRFKGDKGQLKIYFKDLSDGEKCFFLCAILLAANKFYGPFFCFWDEPDNYLSLSEVGFFQTNLRRAFANGGQFLATSHNPEAINKFSKENIFVLDRKNHLEPTLIRLLADISFTGDLVTALTCGDIEL